MLGIRLLLMESDRILYGPERISSEHPLPTAATEAVTASTDAELETLYALGAALENKGRPREWVFAGQIRSSNEIRSPEHTEELLQRLADRGLVWMQHGEDMPDLWRLTSFGTSVYKARRRRHI